MNHRNIDSTNQLEIVKLFSSVFTDSEGKAAGETIGNLACDLSKVIDTENILCFATYEQDLIIGAVFFTRLYFKENVTIFMLAPIAISTDHQGKGVGQSLINYGLSELRKRSVEVVVTYGDPLFYSKVGFSLLSEKVIQSPLKLSMPEAWLGMSLTDGQIPCLDEKPTCVSEFNNPSLW